MKNLCFLVLFFLPISAIAKSTSLSVRIAQVSMERGGFGGFPFAVRIKNVSQSTQRFNHTQVEPDEWITDNKSIHFKWPEEVLKNLTYTVELKPGEEFKTRIEVDAAGTHPVSFRLGFYPRSVIGNSRVGPFWSNKVSLRPNTVRPKSSDKDYSPSERFHQIGEIKNL